MFKKGDIIRSRITNNIYKVMCVNENLDYAIGLILVNTNQKDHYKLWYKEGKEIYIGKIEKYCDLVKDHNHPHTEIFK